MVLPLTIGRKSGKMIEKNEARKIRACKRVRVPAPEVVKRKVDIMEIRIEKTKAPKEKPVDESKLGFGHIFTDHMFVMDYDTGKGWHDAGVVSYGTIALALATMLLHSA